jgi:hypothetical protein
VSVIISAIYHLYFTSLPPARCPASIRAVHLEKEPVAVLGLVDPIIQKSRADQIAMRSAAAFICV